MIEDSLPSSRRFRLFTLGTLELKGGTQTDLSALVSQPKRAALLVYLALARPRGMQRRDTLLALLWPESDQAKARHALSQLAYQLRRTLGGDVLTSRGDEVLGIDTDQLWCDAAAFESAIAADRPEEALELYRGDFLAGFHVPDAAPEWEEWVAAERTRARNAASTAARSLALREEEAGNQSGAVHWRRRVVALAPEDEHAVGDLISLLARMGDRAGALRVYDEFARRLADGLDLRPSRALRQQIDKIRQTPTELPGYQPAPASPLAIEGPATITPRLTPRRPWRYIAGVVGLASVLVTAALVWSSRSRERERPVVALGLVSDFTRADTGVSAPMVADLLATSLARLSEVRVIAMPRMYEVQSQLAASTHTNPSLFDAARQVGAGQLIQGTVHAAPKNGVRLELQRIDVKTGAVRKGYRSEGPDLFTAVDRATAAVAQDLGAAVPEEPVAEVTTRSLVAYRFYEEGVRAYYASDGSAADRLFRSALDEDSSFAMAAYWVWTTSVLRGMSEVAFLERAARLADRTTDRERLIIRARLAETRLEPVAAAFAETLAVRYPDEPDAHLMLGRVQMSQGHFLKAAQQYRRVLMLDSLGLDGQRAQCRACDAYSNLTLTYLWADSLDAAERIAREWVRRQPSSATPWFNLSGILEVAGRQDASLAAVHVGDSLSSGDIIQDAVRARLAMRRGDYVDADLRLRRLVAEGGWSSAEWFLGISLRDQGRLEEAMALPGASHSVLRPILLLESGRPREAAADFEARARGPLASSPPVVGHVAKNLAFNLTLAATCLAAAGDTARLAGLADTVEQAGASSLIGREVVLSHYIRGLLFAARKQPIQAAEQYRKAIYSWNGGYTRVNYELGRTLLELGRPGEAVAVLQPAFRGSLEAANTYVSRTELHELLARAFQAAGEHDSAAVHWRAVERAWRQADPQYRARWEMARRAIASHR